MQVGSAALGVYLHVNDAISDVSYCGDMLLGKWNRFRIMRRLMSDYALIGVDGSIIRARTKFE
jgi:hypothetical protein